MKYLLLILPILLGCNLKEINLQGNLSNQGTIGSGTTSGNTQTITVDMEQMDIAGDRLLTKEEIKKAKSAYERGLRDAKQEGTMYGGARIHYVAIRPANLSTNEMLEKFPKMKKAHPDLQYYVTRLYNAHPYFVVGEVQRSKARQKKLVAKGVSWTNNSRHLRTPSLAADLIPKRGKRVDYNDVDSIFYLQGLGNGIGGTLGSMPCSVFASRIENVFGWQFGKKKIRDGYHHQNNPRKECSNGNL